MGSFLRVTGSTLWAPGTAALDPTEAGGAIFANQQESFSSASTEDMAAPGAAQLSSSNLYASSVEMVTTPETYPIWRTRRPVVLVVHCNKKSGGRKLQHHYYRYLVVSPGGNVSALMGGGGVEMEDDVFVDPSVSQYLVSTSNEDVGSTPVMQWEDPFRTLDRTTGGETSVASINSSVVASPGTHTKADYRNLPYRTVDIDIVTGKPVLEESEEAARMDHWNIPDDVSFRSYLIREAVRRTRAGCRIDGLIPCANEKLSHQSSVS